MGKDSCFCPLEFRIVIKYSFINMVLGERQGLTIIGPASMVKQIKKDPNKIEVLMRKGKKKKKNGKR